MAEIDLKNQKIKVSQVGPIHLNSKLGGRSFEELIKEHFHPEGKPHSFICDSPEMLVVSLDEPLPYPKAFSLFQYGQGADTLNTYFVDYFKKGLS